MDEHLLDSGSGDAIARDWELPELPSGMLSYSTDQLRRTPSLPTSTSLPTSQELAEIFGTSDDEDDDFPFPLSTDLNISSETKQFANSSLFSSVIGQETSLFLGQLGDPLAMGEVGGATKRESVIENKEDVSKTTGSVAEAVAKEGEEEMEVSSDAADNLVETSPGSAPVPVRKSSRLSSQQKYQKTEDIKPTKPPKQVEEKSKISSVKIAEKQTSVQVETVETKSGKEEAATKEEEEVETEELEDSEDDDESISDDPDRLWCICMKPHNDRFMICCDQCEEWFHGDCVGITVNQGKRMERAGKEYICPVCTEKGKQEKEEKTANRLARQAKREEVREAKFKDLRNKSASEKQTKETHTHKKRSLSSSHSYSTSGSKDSGDQYGLSLLFQPDNAPLRPSSSTPPSSAGKEETESTSQEGGERRRRAFYHKEEAVTTSCLAPGCSAQTTPPSRYCSEACIENYTADALKKLASRGITFEANPSEFVRGSKGVSMVDKVAGKTVIGIQAPTDKTLASWIKLHQSYEVLLPSGKSTRGLSAHSRPSRVKIEEGAESRKGGRERREGESPSKQRSLNDPETVRTNAKKALLQTLWKRKEAVEDVMVTQDEVEEIANRIEEQLYSLHGDINTKYKTKYRSLLFNLKDTKNQGLFRKVCLGQISPTELVRMKSEQFASDELAEWREKTLKKDLDKIVEREEDARSNRKAIRKITYKGEVEIEAEQTETIETIAPPEEQDLTPSTPLTPPAMKPAVQSQDGAKASDDGTKAAGKPDGQTGIRALPASSIKQDGQKTKHGKEKEQKSRSMKSNKTESASKNEVKAVNSETEKKDAENTAGGVLLDLLTDTTSEHGSHIYHPHCQICLGKKPPPPPSSESTRDEDEQHSNTEYDNEDMQTESSYQSSLPPPLPLLWEGLVDMPGTVMFSSSAYPVSGDAEYIAAVLPPTLHVMGRIAHVQVWDYIDKLQSSSSREIVVLRFDWTEEDRDAYESLLNYLVRKHRCGVVDEQLHGIKDFYLVPLMVDQEVPANLLPFNGPGLPEDRPNLLLGVIVQAKGMRRDSPQPNSVPELPLSSSLSGSTHSVSLKRHLSASSDDQMVDATVPKRKYRQITVGFGGQTPPLLDGDEESSRVEPMDVGSSATSKKGHQKQAEKLQMSFYGKHQALAESRSPQKTSGTSLSTSQSSGIKSILSQLSDEKLRELASAMSSIEESSTPASSETSPSTVTSPATGQMVTASSLSASVPTEAHSHHPMRPDVPQQQAPGTFDPPRFHHPPNVSRLQRPPLHSSSTRTGDDSGNMQHDATTYGPQRFSRSGPGPPPAPIVHQQQHSYSSPPTNEQQLNRGAPQSNYNWDTPSQHPHQPPQHYQSRPNGPPDTYNVGGPPPQTGGPPQHSGPPPQYSGPPHEYSGAHHRLGSPQQYSGPPIQHAGGPPNQYSTPPQHQGSPQQYSGPPSQHAGVPPPQHSGPPHQYSPHAQSTAPPPQHTGGAPNQQMQHHGPPHQYSGPPHQYSGPPQEQSGPPLHQNAPNFEARLQQPHYPNQHGNNPGYSENQEWSREVPPPQSYSHHSQYYQGESRIDQLESRDYGHRSQPPKHTWKPGHSGGQSWQQGHHKFRGREGRR